MSSHKIIIPKNNILSFFEAPEKFDIETISELPPIDKELWDLWIKNRRFDAIKLFNKQNNLNNIELVAWYFLSYSTVKHCFGKSVKNSFKTKN